MLTAMEQRQYTAEQIAKIIDRIAELRVRWLSHVETQLASQQNHVASDD